MRCLWGLLGLIWAQDTLALKDIWLRYRYLPREYELIGAEALWGWDDTKGVLYRFREAAPAETLWKGDLEPSELMVSREGRAVLFLEPQQARFRRSAWYSVHYWGDGKAYAIPGLYRAALLGPEGAFVILSDGRSLYQWHTQASQPEVLMRLDTLEGEIGVADWLYEEEFGFTRAFELAPSGRYLAYLVFDHREVPRWPWIPNQRPVYPKVEPLPYPKAGQPNPGVSLWVMDLVSRSPKKVFEDTSGNYLPLFFWSEMEDKLFFVHLDRLQNRFTLYEWSFEVKAPKVFLQDSTPYWFSLDNRRLFVQRSDQPELFYKAERRGEPVIERYDYKGRKLATYRVSGLKDMVGFAQGRLFFLASGQSPVSQRVGYLDIRKGVGKPEWLSPAEGWAEAISSASLVFVSYSRYLTPPRFYLVSAKDPRKRYELPDINASLRESLPKVGIRFFRVANRGGDSLWAYLLMPVDFDPQKRYPVLLHMYGGPGSQEVADRFKGIWLFWYARLVQKGYLVVQVDGRGTAPYPAKQRYAIYRQLGTLETQDLLDAIGYLRALPYVSGVAVMGWSFGGYLAARLALEAQPDALAAAVAIASVTDWRLYDSAYTERFMQTPKENSAGYEETSLIRQARDLEVPLLLIHGDADDNVHPQHAIQLLEALWLRNPDAPITWLYYPGQNHGIGRYRYQLFRQVEAFLDQHLMAR